MVLFYNVFHACGSLLVAMSFLPVPPSEKCPPPALLTFEMLSNDFGTLLVAISALLLPPNECVQVESEIRQSASRKRLGAERVQIIHIPISSQKEETATCFSTCLRFKNKHIHGLQICKHHLARRVEVIPLFSLWNLSEVDQQHAN